MRRTGGGEGGAGQKGNAERSRFSFARPAFVPALTKRAQSLPGKVVLTFTLDKHVSSSSPPAQSSVPSQACSSGMNLTEPLQKKYLLSISFLTAVGKRGSGSGHDSVGGRHGFLPLIREEEEEEEERPLTEEGRSSEDGQEHHDREDGEHHSFPFGRLVFLGRWSPHWPSVAAWSWKSWRERHTAALAPDFIIS